MICAVKSVYCSQILLRSLGMAAECTLRRNLQVSKFWGRYLSQTCKDFTSVGGFTCLYWVEPRLHQTRTSSVNSVR